MVPDSRTRIGFSWLLPAVLSTTAGAADVIGFLALGGLFVAHITGNLVMIAVHYVTGGFSRLGPLVAVPVFVCALGAVTLALGSATDARVARRVLLMLHAVLHAAFFGFGAALGPFANPESGVAVFVGMLGVVAMASQNALVKLAVAGSPTTAVMTTNATILVIDVATILRGQADAARLAQARERARGIFPCIAGFVAGCAAGALLEIHWGLAALCLPAALAALAVPLGELWPDHP